MIPKTPVKRKLLPNSLVRVVPHEVNCRQYTVTLTRADQLVACGQAEWIPGLNSIREKALKPRGQLREWRKTACIEPINYIDAAGKVCQIEASMPTMQFVEVEDRRAFGNVPHRPNLKSNRKRVRMSPQVHPLPPSIT